MARGRCGSARRPARSYLIQASGIARYGTARLRAIHRGLHLRGRLPGPGHREVGGLRPRRPTDAGGRVVVLRTSPVMDRSGGTFVPLKLAWCCGLGATLGDGRQRMPMISLRRLRSASCSGPPTTAARRRAVQPDLAGADHQRRVHRRAWPASCTGRGFFGYRPRSLRTALGELAGQLVGDMYAVPERLTGDGFVFSDPTVADLVAYRTARLIARRLIAHYGKGRPACARG